MLDLENKLAVITGAADGIGAALARQLALRKMRLAILDIRGDAAAATAANLRALGVEAESFACDVSICAQVEDAAQAVRARMGEVSLVWANAGLGIPQGILGARRDDLKWMYSVNLDGLIDTLRAFVAPMQAQQGWRWVGVTGSIAGLVRVASGASGAYSASKHAAIGVAEAIRGELEPSGVGVTLLCPGIVSTRIWDGERARPDRFGGPAHRPEAVGEQWRQTGMNVDAVCEIAVQAMVNGDFYAVVADNQSTADRIETRADAIRTSVRLCH